MQFKPFLNICFSVQMLDTLIELVGFEGNEFYVTPANSLVVGLPFAGLQSVFPMCVPVGLKSARGGKILLKPPPDRVVEAGGYGRWLRGIAWA